MGPNIRLDCVFGSFRVGVRGPTAAGPHPVHCAVGNDRDNRGRVRRATTALTRMGKRPENEGRGRHHWVWFRLRPAAGEATGH